MACDCPTAPFLPGPDTSNVIISPGENVPISVDWCAQVGTGAIQASTWEVSPDTLTIETLATEGSVTSALVTSDVPGALYRATNTVQVLPLAGSVQTYKFTVQVYVAGPLSLDIPGGDPVCVTP